MRSRASFARARFAAKRPGALPARKEAPLSTRNPERTGETILAAATEEFSQNGLDGARHLKRSGEIPRLHSPPVSLLAGVLRKGEADGVFRLGVDPVQLYISIAWVCYFYMSNADTLSTVFATDLRAPKAIYARREHAAKAILGYLRR